MRKLEIQEYLLSLPDTSHPAMGIPTHPTSKKLGRVASQHRVRDFFWGDGPSLSPVISSWALHVAVVDGPR